MDDIEVFDHLKYELKMFISTYRTLASRLFGDGAIHNAVLESFAIHTRNLIAFLFYDETDDYVVSKKFVLDTEKWEKERGKLSECECLKIANDRANNLVAHLTYHRSVVLTKQKEWQIDMIYKEIIKVFKLFLKHKNLNSTSQERDDQIINEYNNLLSGTESEGTLNWTVCTAGTTSDFSCLPASFKDEIKIE